MFSAKGGINDIADGLNEGETAFSSTFDANGSIFK